MRLRLLAVFMLSVITCFAQSSSEVKEILVELANPTTTSTAALRLIKLAHGQPDIYRVISQKLPAMLLQTRDVRVVQSEAKVAGALGLESTIPSLIQLLSWFNYEGNVNLNSLSSLRYDPVARALYEIGKPAEPALSEALESTDPQKRGRVIGVLVLRNTPESRVILRQHLDKEPDPHFKNFIELNLDRAAK
jgi:HEAT repeat protein